jgi:hypothetical protein
MSLASQLTQIGDVPHCPHGVSASPQDCLIC